MIRLVVACSFSFALMTRLTHAFLPVPRKTSKMMALKSKNELFDSPGWEAIREELDQVPIFAVANAEGQPLKYSIETSKKKDDDGDNKFEVPLFYTHVEDALKELDNARTSNPLPGMDMYVINAATFLVLYNCSMCVLLDAIYPISLTYSL